MRITKAKIKNRSLEVEYNEKRHFIGPEGGDPIESSRDLSAKCYDVCHDDLVSAFDQLKPHAVMIADLRDAIKVENAIASGLSLFEFDLEELSSIQITGFVVTGSDEDGSEAAMIIFQKKTGTRTLNITTPAVKFEDEDYAFSSEFAGVVINCIAEVEAYLNGKVAVKQLEMNFDEGFNAEDVAVSQEPKKRGRKAKIEGFSASREEDGTIVLTTEEKVA